MTTFGITSILVSKDDLQTIEDALEIIDEAIYSGAVADEEGGIVKQGVTAFRARIATALGS